VTALGPQERFAQSFKGVMAAVRRLRGRETHRPGDLSYAQYGLLFGLAAGGALSAGELAVAADVSPASATQMLEAMEKAGLVARVRSGDDRRVVLTSLTEHGRQVVEARRLLLEPRWRAALAEFSDRDLAIAGAVLDRITEMFDELAAERPEPAKLTPAA
jgi:DNA-binding MarR family transcriptional regulator